MDTPKDIQRSDDYKLVLADVKRRVQEAQYAALKAVNRELIALYWDIGRIVVEKQEALRWGEGVIETLARDLRVEFEGVSGFSTRNLRYMKRLYLTYRNNPKLQPMVAEIGWTHNIIILDKCKDDLEREFYLRASRKSEWSKYTLTKQINDKAYQRYLSNQTSFDHTLPEEQRAKSVLAVKDDYNFDFLGIEGEPTERELETALVANITKFLAEMGAGRGYFAFIGRQFRVEVSDEEFFLDLLFYHRELKCLVAVELKAGPFKPEYAGKMQFYLSALDDKVRVEGENPSIGIIVCRAKDRTIVEYTLRDLTRPIGVASYNHYGSLEQVPDKISKYLPSPDEIEHRLSNMNDE
jgi:predicted nuclease of restriction endonuclease-like (RecB) superfamily